PDRHDHRSVRLHVDDRDAEGRSHHRGNGSSRAGVLQADGSAADARLTPSMSSPCGSRRGLPPLNDESYARPRRRSVLGCVLGVDLRESGRVFADASRGSAGAGLRCFLPGASTTPPLRPLFVPLPVVARVVSPAFAAAAEPVISLFCVAIPPPAPPSFMTCAD